MEETQTTAGEELHLSLSLFLLFFYWQPKHAGFHSFSGTFASVLPTALNNGALCAYVR